MTEGTTRDQLANDYGSNASALLTEATKQVGANGATVTTLTQLATINALLALEQRLAAVVDELKTGHLG